MINYDDVAPNPHRLRVVGWLERYGAHECRVGNSHMRVVVDLSDGGAFPEGTAPESLIGKTVSVDYVHGWLWLASNAQVDESENG